MPEPNQRRFPRVSYPCQLTIWLPEGHYDTVLANASNIGQGGLCVQINREIVVGIKVEIEIDFNDGTNALRCKGSVVRCRQESNKVYNIGIQFEPLGEAEQAYLDKKIAQLIHLGKKVDP